LQCCDIFLYNTCFRYSNVVDFRKVRAQKATVSSQSIEGGVASSIAARKTGKRSKSLRRLLGNKMKQWGNEMTSTHRPSLNNRWSFRLVDLTISFAIEHLAIFSKLIYCIATCIANGTASINSGAAVPTSPTTTSLRVASWSSGTFYIISLLVPSFSCVFNHACFSYTRLRSLTVKWARRHAQR
jgi:hypothetical protein